MMKLFPQVSLFTRSSRLLCFKASKVRDYTVSGLSEAYQILSESSRLSFQIFSQSPATKPKVLYNQKSSEQYQHPIELANKNHQRRFQI